MTRYESDALDSILPRLTRAADDSKLWMAFGAVMFVTGRKELRRAAMRGLLAIAGTSALVNGPLKWMGRRKRPALDLVPEARRLLKIPVTTSFPSGHTASAFAFATGATVEYRKAAFVLYPLATAVGVSRVYTGAHYPGDVVAGATIGMLAAAATARSWPIPPEVRADAAPARIPADRLPSAMGEGLSIVVNEASGRPGQSLAARLGSLLPKATITEVDPSDGDALGSALSDAAKDARAIGICGGDGSVNTAARVAMDHDIPLVVIPGGTLDHFAGALGLGSIREAVEVVKRPRAISVDVGWIDGRPFLNTASLGSYAEMVEAREQLEKRVGKWPALMVAMIRVLRRSQPADVEIDGEAKKIWLAFFGNCHYRPAGFGPSWRERLDDGLIDLRYVEAGPPLARTRLLAAMLTGRLGRSKIYQQRPVASVAIASLDGEPRLSRDGEIFRGSGSFEVSKTERSLKVLVPHE